jgi:DNA-binding transcriptional LysR family regulator
MYGPDMVARNAPPRPGIRRRRPIQLAALRGFESAARQLSFTLAADELALTQSSISRQISALERQVGKPLFVRKTRALELTSAGQRLQRAVQQALIGIDRSVDEIRGVGLPPRITLTTYASFASLWLVPRLAEFQRAHPEIEIRIDAGDRFVDLQKEGVDVALRWCRPDRTPVPSDAIELIEEFVTPAVSSRLIERTRVTLNKPADLYKLPLLDMDDTQNSSIASSWQRWFDFAQVPPQEPTGGRVTFSFIDQAVQAAVRGQGAVMGRTPLIEDSVANGDLTTPFPKLRMRTGYRYYLLVNPESARLPHVAAFTQWLLEELRRGPRRLT